jgi:hypothetical protein
MIDIKKVIRDHELWLRNEGGKQANLRGANLQEANLRGANLRGANLRGATLQEADLRGATLQEANLRAANLRGANLQEADLRGADLRAANLRGADLRGAEEIPAVPRVVDLDRKILKALSEGGALDMNRWHTCDTVHCIAGWAITLAGTAGKNLEDRVGPKVAGALIYRASTGTVPDFYADNAEALIALEKRAADATRN